MFLTAKLLLAALCGYLDRFRGSRVYDLRVAGYSVDALAYGLLAAILIGANDLWLALACAVLFMLGEKLSYGEPWGALLHDRPMRAERLEWWQVGPLAKSAAMACLLRGLLWGAPCLLLLPWLPGVAAIPVSMGAAFVLAPLLARHCDGDNWRWPLPPTDKWLWDKAEALRGWLFGGFLLLASFV